MREADDLGLKAKALQLEALARKFKAEVIRQTIRKTMNVAFGCSKRLAFVKGHKSEYVKAYRIDLALIIKAKSSLKEDR